jgi:hypothetical protein
MNALALPRLSGNAWKTVLMVLFLFALTAGSAFAQQAPGGGIPEVQLPQQAQEGGLPGLIRWILGIIMLLCATAVAGFALISVGGAGVTKFKMYTDGRGDLGEVITTVVLGVGILFFALALAYMATRVIPVEIT